MKQTAVLAVVSVFVLSACIPLSFPVRPTALPVIDAQATDAVIAATQVAETLDALPTPTLVPATDTLALIPTETESPSATAIPSETLTPEPNFTATVTGTATVAPQTNVTGTETLHPRFFGTLPPAIPYGKIALINKAKAEVYVSLQCNTIDGYKTIIEYPVAGRFNVNAPAGMYSYVAWVGGREFQGSFKLDKGEDLSITFNKDKITIK
jgi:hypothetical protein